MRLLLWLLLCVVLTIVAGPRRRQGLLLLVLALWLTIPWIASDVITGISPVSRSSLPSMHPASWLVLVLSCYVFSSQLGAVFLAVRTRLTEFLLVGLFVAICVLVTVVQTGGRGLMSIIYLVALPACYCVLVLLEAQRDAGFVKRIRTLLLVVASCQAMLGIVQRATGAVFFFGTEYARYSWWSGNLQRAIGTTDHPLMLSLLLVSVMPLTLSIERSATRFATQLLFLGGVLATGSRVGLVVGTGIVVVLLVRSRMHYLTRGLFSVALLVLMTLVFSGTILPDALDRFTNDAGSNRVRYLAYALFLKEISNHLFLGGGASSSYGVLESAGLSTSFESTFMIYAVDFGVLATVMYFSAILSIGLRGIARRPTVIPGACGAFLVVLAVIQSYSGGAIQSSAASLLWTMAAIAAVRASDQDPIALDAFAGHPNTNSGGDYGDDSGK